GGRGDGSYCLGVLLTFLSAGVFGFYTVTAKKFALRYGSLAMNSLSFVLGSLLLLPLLYFLGLPVFSASRAAWLRIAYLSICVTGIAYYTYFSGLSMCDTSLGSMVFFIKPVLASLLAAAVLGEAVTWRLGAGIILILFGIYIVQQATKQAVGAGEGLRRWLRKTLY
ncbi:MAG: EamA family transporter, partial [Thermacetogeniaceae bacterium]